MPTYSAQRIIDRALSTIGVLEAEESATADQQTDALDDLNDILNEWAARGVGSGHTDVTASDELELDAGEYRALRLALAIELTDYYVDRPATAGLHTRADNALRRLEARYNQPGELCTDLALNYRRRYNILLDH